jgi:hypothetical protein
MIRRSILLRVVIGLLLVLFLFSFSIKPGEAATGIKAINISNVRGETFVVSWTTDIASNGSVTWGSSAPPSNTVTDGVTSTTTHYVTISGLLPDHIYYFQVTSGDETDNNSGLYYQVTTGPSLFNVPAHTVYGYVYLTNGTTVVPNAIVYLQLQDDNGNGSPGSSQLVSARADSTGLWSFTLKNTRESDFQDFFSYTLDEDNLKIIGQGGINGTIGYDPAWTIPIPTTYPYRVDVVLSQDPTAVIVSTFTGYVRYTNVQLEWKTATEVGLVGFNVYRSDSIDGVKQKLNTDLLPAQYPGQMNGATYQFNNMVNQGQHYYYWLELGMIEGSEFFAPVILDTNYWVLLPAIVR